MVNTVEWADPYFYFFIFYFLCDLALIHLACNLGDCMRGLTEYCHA